MSEIELRPCPFCGGKAVLEVLYDISSRNYGSFFGHGINKACDVIEHAETAFDKEKVIEELKSWEKASHDAGIQSTYAELDNKASGYYQESRAYHRAIEIVEKGGLN